MADIELREQYDVGNYRLVLIRSSTTASFFLWYGAAIQLSGCSFGDLKDLQKAINESVSHLPGFLEKYKKLKEAVG